MKKNLLIEALICRLPPDVAQHISTRFMVAVEEQRLEPLQRIARAVWNNATEKAPGDGGEDAMIHILICTAYLLDRLQIVWEKNEGRPLPEELSLAAAVYVKRIIQDAEAGTQAVKTHECASQN